MEQLRVAEVLAVAEAGPGLLLASGKVVMRRARRFSDFANHPDSQMEMHRATVRTYAAAPGEVWEEVEGLTLGRDQILVMVPIGDDDPGASPQLLVPGQEIRAKIVCGGLHVTGFVRVPLQATLASFMRESRLRFIAVSRARVAAISGETLEGLQWPVPFCVVNRMRMVACVETRAEVAAPTWPPLG